MPAPIAAPASFAEVMHAASEKPDLESSTDGYALRFAGAVGAYMLEVQARITLELLRPWPGARVLDVGGGHAQLAVPLVRAGYAVTVLGSSEAALTRVQRLAPGVETLVGELCDPPVEDRSFDVAIAFRMMPHVRDWRALIAGLGRVARHAVIVDFPSPRSANALTPLLFGAKKRLEGDTREYAMIARGQVRGALRAAGLARVVERPQFFVPMVAHRAVKRPGVSRLLEGAATAAGLTKLFGSPVIVRGSREVE